MAQINQADDPKLVTMQLPWMKLVGPRPSTNSIHFGERHGSWQRTIHAWSAPDILDRYLIAAVTSLDDGDEIVVMAGAEERSVADSAGRPRFRRFDVGSIRLNGDWPTADIKNLLAQAVRMAVEIQPIQLEEMQLLAS